MKAQAANLAGAAAGRLFRRIHFGAVPVAAPWWSSKDLLRPRSNFFLRPGSLESRHDIPIPISLAGVSQHLQASCAFVAHPPSSASNLRSQTTIEPSPTALRLAASPIPRVFLITATPLNLHKCFLIGGFLQTVDRTRPGRLQKIYLPLHMGRLRYSTSVYGQRRGAEHQRQAIHLPRRFRLSEPR